MFKNKVCIVTGGANGIGKYIVSEFDKNDANVIYIDFDKTNGEKLAQTLKQALFFHGDISKQDTLDNFYKFVVNKYNKIDYLINNACFGKSGILSNCSYDDFNSVLLTGITAPYYLSLLFKSHFNENGSIVNISSTRALMSQRDSESYAATKGGIISLTHALAASLAGKIRVNCISPGWIDTSAFEYEAGKFSLEDEKQHTVGRIGAPIDIVKTIMFLCSDDAKFINAQNIIVDGGMTKKMIYHADENWQLNLEGKNV